MLGVLREKVRSLVFGEDGVALVVTLASFFFMYLMAMGVYAVGTSVKERIHLQNACDAAAYSAAVVQADTLSRIATINRAMSWTYVQMTRRQMDYITYKWADHAAQHYHDDKSQADIWVSANTHSACQNPSHKHDVDFSEITLNGADNHFQEEDDKAIRRENAKISSHIDKYLLSFYAKPTGTGITLIQGQIEEDYRTLEKMGRGLQDLAYTKLCEKMRIAIDTVLDANLQTADYKVYDSLRDLYDPHDPHKYSRELRNEWDDENLFLSFSLRGRGDANSGEHNYVFDAFESSGDDSLSHAWFRRTGGGGGLRRRYAGNRERLMAEWTWHATAWNCTVTPTGKPVCIPTPYTMCAHPSHEKCQCSIMPGLRMPSKVIMHTESVANNNLLYPVFCRYYDTPETATARALVLESSYFGKEGTITVGIACKNENPWLSVLKTISGGMFSAFDPYCKKTVVFASAKAGYRTYDEGMTRKDRKYKIDWRNEEEWNLYTSDWDAVLMPVRMAKTMATDRHWNPAEGNFLGEWVEQLGVKDDEMRAGGEAKLAEGKLPFDREERTQSMSEWWRKLPAPHRTFAVQTKWQVGYPHQRPAWNQLTNRMFH